MRKASVLVPVAATLVGIVIGAVAFHGLASHSLSAVGAAAPARDARQPPAPPAAQTGEAVLKQFHQIWYSAPWTWLKNRWLGIPAEQNPMDAWIIQEIMFDTKPDFMIECGSFLGGGAALWATLLDQVNPAARVISIDIEDKMAEARRLPIVERKVEFLIGSSTSPAILEKVKERVRGKKVLVLLDSDHRAPHVLEEIRAYAPLVPVGGYLIVQDGNINGHPVRPDYGPGPYEAIHEFLRGNDSFTIDKSRERMMFTFSPDGFLKRTK
ncbi:MAG TPA: CmcI family methyltransferase [Polyangia bacterium]|jgi:Cephalosporin hydroxylase|nr:CmcI family methyltransferase [Polyangia bacterium]